MVKTRFERHRLKLMQCFTFRWLTNRLGRQDGFTACFRLAVSWLGVLWWMWLLSTLLCLSRDHCVFSGRVRGGAVGNLELGKRFSLISELIWKGSSCPPLVHRLCPVVPLQSLSSCCPNSSFLICWCSKLCCWYDIAAPLWYLVAHEFSLTTSVADCSTALSSTLLPSSKDPSFDFVICTSPVTPQMPLSDPLWGFSSPVFSLFKDFFDLCGLRGTILGTSECEFPVMLQSPTGLGSFVLQVSQWLVSLSILPPLPFGRESKATGLSKFFGLSRWMLCSYWQCLMSLSIPLPCLSCGDPYPFSWMAFLANTESWCPLVATVSSTWFISISPVAVKSVSCFRAVPRRVFKESLTVWQLFIFASVQGGTKNASLPIKEVLLISTLEQVSSSSS